MDNPISWLAKISHKEYGVSPWKNDRNTDYVEQEIVLNKSNFGFAVRALYQFKDEDHWHDLPVKDITARFIVNGSFVHVKGLNFESLFELVNNAYNAIIKNDGSAAEKFMKQLKRHENYNKGFSEDKFYDGGDVELFLTYSLHNPNHSKDVQTRIDDDYLAIAHDYVSHRSLISLKDIDTIENSNASYDERDIERTVRTRHYKMMDELEDQEPFITEQEDEALAVEDAALRDLARLERNHRYSTRSVTRKARGILKKRENIKRNLQVLLDLIPYSHFKK